jgi:hypothetical protein
VESFEVVQIAQLARLADSFAASEPLMTVKSQAVIQVVVKAREKQNRANGGACAALARIAMHNDDVLRVL